jgi:hypothetical protein
VRDTFHIVSVKDGKQDMEAILEVLREIKSGKLKNDLKLLNYHDEVPISFPVKIDKVDVDSIECTAHQAQAVVLGLQKQALLTSTAFTQGMGVHCFVEYVNVKNCFAILGRFAYAAIRADRRGAVRVRVDGVVPVTYCTEDQSVAGRASDVSVTGIALNTHQALPAGLSENGQLQVTVQGTTLVLPAGFVKTVEKDDAFVHTFTIDPDQHADKVLSQYIYTRQVEIIRQLKEQFL